MGLITNTMARKRKLNDGDDEQPGYTLSTTTLPEPLGDGDTDTTAIISDLSSRSETLNSSSTSSNNRVSRSDASINIASLDTAVEELISGVRYPKHGKFSTPTIAESNARPPPIPPHMKDYIKTAVRYRDYNQRDVDENAPRRPDGTKPKMESYQAQRPIPLQLTDHAMFDRISRLTEDILRHGKAILTPNQHFEADMETGRIHNSSPLRTVAQNSEKKLEWLFDLMRDTRDVVRHPSSWTNPVTEQCDGIQEFWISEGVIEDVD